MKYFFIYLDMLNPEKPVLPGARWRCFQRDRPRDGEDQVDLGDFDTSGGKRLSPAGISPPRTTASTLVPRADWRYYIFRVFIPILLIIGISYITFFLKDFTRRIQVATGNVLLFIAFSWSLAEDYPRMGYLTFLDAIMAITFIINTLVVMYNVYLKWLETERSA